MDLTLPPDAGYVEVDDRAVGVLAIYRAGRQLIVTAFHVVPEAREGLAETLREYKGAASGYYTGEDEVGALANAVQQHRNPRSALPVDPSILEGDERPPRRLGNVPPPDALPGGWSMYE